MHRAIQLAKRLHQPFARHRYRVSPVRCLVVGKYRGGSNFLAHLINNHPDARLHTELFNVSRLAKRPGWLTYPGNCIADFYGFSKRQHRAKGFKLMYDQLSIHELQRSNWPAHTSERILTDIASIHQNSRLPMRELERRLSHALYQLTSDTDLRVIHLKRTNLLDLLISTKRAISEDNWHGKSYTTAAITLSPEECEHFFEHTLNQQQKYDRLFEKCDVLQVTYEQLTENTDNCLRTIQRHLSIPQMNVQTSGTRRQSASTRSDVLANHAELKQHFSSSRWARFFD